MDNLSIFSALGAMRIGFGDGPLADPDLRVLYARKRRERPYTPGHHIPVVNRTMDEPSRLLWHRQPD